MIKRNQVEKKHSLLRCLCFFEILKNFEKILKLSIFQKILIYNLGYSSLFFFIERGIILHRAFLINIMV